MTEMKKTFKAAIFNQETKELKCEEIEFPQLQSGEILIKVEASPINPSDQMFIQGHYPGNKSTKCIPGFEGAGTVIQSGGGFFGWMNNGKRVAFSGKSKFYGAWAEYCVVEANSVIPLPDNVTFQQGASSLVNPLSVIAMLEIVQSQGVKTVVHTAAASQLGRMMNRYFKENYVNVINVVRKDQQVKILKDEGAQYILNQNDPNFETELKELSQKLNATIAFDAVGGELTKKVLTALPKKSTIFVYGGLDVTPCQVPQKSLIFEEKSVKGFWLPVEINKQGIFKKLGNVNKVKKLLTTSLKTEISKIYQVNQINEALKYYSENMSLGKVLICPTQNQ